MTSTQWITRAEGRRVSEAAPALLDATLLHDELAIGDAINALESHLVVSAGSLDDTIRELLAVRHCLEYALSAINSGAFSLIYKIVMQGFPDNVECFVASLQATLLDRFSLYFLFLPYPDHPREQSQFLTSHRRHVESAIPLLRALTNMRVHPSDAPVDADDMNEFADAHFAVRRKDKQKKRSNRFNNFAPDVLKSIADDGTSIPTTPEEAGTMIMSVLERQKTILQDYLNMFREPRLATMIRDMYIPQHAPAPDVSALVKRPEKVTEAVRVESDAQPSAYPFVQPMKAALYFDSVNGFGEWRILISTRADRNLRQARNKNPKLFKIIVKKIRELSRGHFSEDNQKRLTGLDVEIPIYEAKMTSDTRLVYHVDCVPEFESDVTTVLKIFGIYTHAQLDRRFWDCVSRQLERRGAEYRKRCTYRNRPRASGDNVVMPASWPPPTEPIAFEKPLSLSDMRKGDLEELHSLLVLEKFVTFSQALLNSILADKDVAYVFDVSPHEKRIIEHPSSCFVLGRSGTGKTTTMMFKMLGIERSWESHRDTMAKPRQLFVTQSRVLAEKVEEYFTKLLDSLATANQSAMELSKTASQKKAKEEQGLVDLDEEIYWHGGLPKRYGELKEENFPMFLTYDHVCRLLEAEFHYAENAKRNDAAVSRAMQDVLEPRGPQDTDGVVSNDYMQQRRASFVSFGTFLEEYWSHFSGTKGLDPTLVFGEFMGVIKGSEEALAHPEGYLDMESYCKLSHRTQATFASQRENIYRLFQAYLKKKKERGDYDAADRTHALINFLKTMGVPGQEVDFIYVDEAQDNLLIDAVVLRTLCRNPRGMFWAGDTAQTISVGSAFRFNDLKAFLYRYEEATALGNTDKRVQPESFHLAVNYRSHAGIVDCAYSVIELITQFWPNAIDALGRETGMVAGLKPVFFSGWDQNTVRYEQFLFGASGSHIEFGAQQCILVRDEAARERLRAQVGDIGLILTLYESKGLEFNDVLLFNFFEDSTADVSQWRVVLNAVPPEQRGKLSAPRFDEARHSGICRELKFLYVAITRARKNLWIADCSDKGDPMRFVWTRKDLIQNCNPNTEVPQLAVSSTAEDWAKMALNLFNHRRYMQAMHCYERAGLQREKAVAHAYHLRDVARSPLIAKADAATRANAYNTAAQAFIASAQEAVTEKRAYYRIAAECYIQSGDDYRAAQAYQNAGEYNLAASHFRKAGKFEEAVEIVRLHRPQMSASIANSIVEVSKLYFLREKRIMKARELFETDEEFLEYMDDYGLGVARASYLEELGRYEDAADISLSEGNILQAIRLLTMDRGNPALVRKATRCLLDGLWRHLPFGTVVNETLLKGDTTLGDLLAKADSLADLNTDAELHDEVSMFRAIAKRDTDALGALWKVFQLQGNAAAALMCLDHIFALPMQLQTASITEVSTKLEIFLEYMHILQKLVGTTTVCSNALVRRLFALQDSPETEDHVLVPPGTFLSAQINPRTGPSARVTEQGTSIPRWELETIINNVFKNRLLQRIRQENEVVRNLRILHPCLPYAAYGRCNRNDCPQFHDNFQRYDAESYNSRVRVVVLQILVYRTVYAVENLQEQLHQQGYWLRKLHDTLFPPYYKLGSPCVFDPALVTAFEHVRSLVGTWVRSLLYSVSYSPDFLTTLLRAVRVALHSDPKVAWEYLHRVPCVDACRPVLLLRGPDTYVVHDLLSCTQNDDENSLNRGILFLDHILGNKIPIDVGVLCDFMEYLSGSLSIAYRIGEHHGMLHNVTLPRSWIMRLAPDVASLSSKNTRAALVFKKHIDDVLEDIYCGRAGKLWLLYDGLNLQRLGYSYRNLFFSRICQIYCLWGYNVRSFRLQCDILRAITSVRQPGRTFHPIIEKYVSATSWEDLARHIRRTSSGTALDEMILLHHESYPVLRNPMRLVRRVIFNRLEEIPWILKTGGPDAPSAGRRADDFPLVPVIDIQEAHNADEDTEVMLEESQDVGGDIFEQGVLDVENITLTIDAEQANRAPAAPTEQEIQAAQTIASAYQRHLARERLRKTTPREEKKRRIFASFLEQSQKMEWPYVYYRLLYQGPIPHLYMVADGIKTQLHEAKSEAKKRFNLARHLELEAVSTALTQTKRLLNQVETLCKALGPTAEVHKSRDLDLLKQLTLQVDEQLRGLPPKVMAEWQKDMKIAMKGIVEPKKAPEKPEKPQLNLADLMDMGSLGLDGGFGSMSFSAEWEWDS
ncbi:hypothetical protein C8Q73DRAFT_119576 [Cubamyces lactineus]|nr:hypothetical protein C8Q73DRAFT_119576 [Cubamyces lactineus]